MDSILKTALIITNLEELWIASSKKIYMNDAANLRDAYLGKKNI